MMATSAPPLLARNWTVVCANLIIWPPDRRSRVA
jgi:hypothetical protein